MKRILIKISGDALKGNESYGYSKDMLLKTASEVFKLQKEGYELALLVGGGNIFRGVSGSKEIGIKRVNSDYMGMLATMMNAIALSEVLNFVGAKTEVLSAFSIGPVAKTYSPKKAKNILSSKKILILGGGTGNPYFTTDTASVLRALEIEADLLLKGTKVDGIFDKDPEKFTDAKMFKKISYNELIKRNIKAMDMTAFTLAKDNNLNIQVYNMKKENTLSLAIKQKIGTFLTNQKED